MPSACTPQTTPRILQPFDTAASATMIASVSSLQKTTRLENFVQNTNTLVTKTCEENEVLKTLIQQLAKNAQLEVTNGQKDSHPDLDKSIASFKVDHGQSPAHPQLAYNTVCDLEANCSTALEKVCTQQSDFINSKLNSMEKLFSEQIASSDTTFDVNGQNRKRKWTAENIPTGTETYIRTGKGMHKIEI